MSGPVIRRGEAPRFGPKAKRDPDRPLPAKCRGARGRATMNRLLAALAAIGFASDCAASRRFKCAGVALGPWQRQLV
jgi:hypothetical protein